MPATDKRKFRSVRRKKTRFHGQRPAEKEKRNDSSCRKAFEPTPCPSSSHENKMGAEKLSDSQTRENVSARKLLNSSFQKYEHQQGILTREKH